LYGLELVPVQSLAQEKALPFARTRKKKMKENDKNRPSKPHILFVCGKNQLRSPTAERTYRNDKRIEVRSAGMSGKSKHPISNDDIEWATLILVMESGYKSPSRARSPRFAPPYV
jgi:hypothetical protein